MKIMKINKNDSPEIMQPQQEKQLLHAAKMAALGELAGGVGHEFNNVLAVVIGNLELMIEMFGAEINDDMNSMLQDALAAAETGAKLTNSLLAFGRPRGKGKILIDVNMFVGEFAGFIKHAFGRNISVDVELANGLGDLQVDQGGLGSALLHLALNAWQAMPDGGQLTLRTSNGEMAPHAADDQSAEPVPCIIIEVSDTGSGMPPDVLTKSSEMFYTTKSSDESSGLGLSLVSDFVRSAAGDLRVCSEPEVGTTFALCLPAQPSGGDYESAASRV